MAFESIKAEVERLLAEIEKRPEDKHELYLELRTKLSELRATGMAVPDDLVRLTQELEAEFAGRPERSRGKHG